MNTKEVCKNLNVSPKMLRIYEQHNLIAPERGDNGYRNYSVEDLMQIRVIVILRKLNFSVKEVKSILEHEKIKTEFQYKFYIQLKAIDKTMKDLAQARNQLKEAINISITDPDEDDIKKMLIHISEEKRDQDIEFIKEWDFDEMAADYVERFLKEDKGYKEAIAKTRKLISNFGAEKSILDVGCGTCNLWETFSPMYLSVLDKSLPMLMVSREKVPWAKFILEDILETSPEKTGTFDVVISTFALHHIESALQKNALEKIVSLCRDEGVTIIVDKSFSNHQTRTAEEKELEVQGKKEELEMLKSEYYLYTNETISFFNYLGYDVDFEELYKNIICYSIRKRV